MLISFAALGDVFSHILIARYDCTLSLVALHSGIGFREEAIQLVLLRKSESHVFHSIFGETIHPSASLNVSQRRHLSCDVNDMSTSRVAVRSS